MSQFYMLGGAERLAVELAEDLNKRGIHADILSMYSEEMPGVAAAKAAISSKGIPAVHFLGMRVHPSILSTFSAFWKLRQLIRKYGYQIVETSSVSPTILAACALWGLPVRHVAGIHAVFRLDRDNSWIYKAWLFLTRCRKSIRYYGVSDIAVRYWRVFSGVPRSRIRRIYNSINSEFYGVKSGKREIRRELRISDDACVVISVGRLVASKGIDTIYEALEPILVERNIYLLYLGTPDPSESCGGAIREKIENKVKDRGLGDRVAFMGHQKDVARIMIAADVLAHPVCNEAFGLVLVEAMAVGVPIVASNVEGIPEVLAGTESILIPPDDPVALRDAVLTVLSRTPEDNKRAIEKGRQRAEEFRIEKRTDAMLTMFEDVLSGRF